MRQVCFVAAMTMASALAAPPPPPTLTGPLPGLPPYQMRAPLPIDDFVVGLGLFNAEGVCCYGTNTHIEGATAGELNGDGEVRFTIDHLHLVEGTYKLDVAVHRENGTPYDYHRLLHTFRVKSRLKEAGIFRPPHRWSFSGGIRISGPQ